MEDILIYHNGECSKCRGALEILQEKSVPHDVRFYIAEPLSRQELTELLGLLKMQPSQLIRTGEELYRDRYEGRQLSEAEWLDVLLQHPSLMQRPIVVKGTHAIIARPPERIYEML